MSIVTYENVDTPIFDIYYPRYVFVSGDDGSLLPDLSAPVDSLFQDAAGTTPVTAYGDYVGLAVDQSGNGRDWVQSTNAARMRYGRFPRSGARNEWNYSDDLTIGTVASGVDMTYLGDGVTRMETTQETGNRRFFRTFPASRTTRFTIDVKADSGTQPTLTLEWNGPGKAFYYLSDGTVTGSSVATIDALADGWWRISAAGYNSGASNQAWVMGYNSDTSVGDAILLRKPQVEEVAADSDPYTPYQLVTERWDITEEGIPDQPILYADLADDAMDIELPAISGGTIVLAGDKGIWIDEFDFAGGTFSYGPTAYTGGPDQLIQNLVGERLIGGFVIDRALTATERAQNIDYYMSRGAPGVWEEGEELVTNGDFSDGLTGWDEAANGYGQVVDGVARIGDSTSNARIWQSSVTTVGGIYLAGINIVDTGGPSASSNYTLIMDNANSGGGNIYLPSIFAGAYSPFDSAVFSATNTILAVRVAGGDTWTDIDSVSLRRLTLNTGGAE